MGGQLLLASVLILVFLFFLPSASPRKGALGGKTGEESALEFTVDSGEDLGGGLDSIENEIGHSSDGSGLFVGSDVVRAKGLASRYAALQDGEEVSRRKRGSGEEVQNIQLAIFTDRSLFNYVRQRYPNEPIARIDQVIRNLTEAMVSSVELYLNHESLGQSFAIEIVHLEVGGSGLVGLEEDQQIRSYLDAFCLWQRKRRMEVSWDHALLLTGLDLYASPAGDGGSSGMAYLSGMCSSQASCTISEARSLGSGALIMAHELAHNMGVDHDGEGVNEDCDGDDFIMGPRLSPGATKWSSCSKRSIARFLDLYGGCLRDSPQQRREASKELPGHRFSGNDQCHLMYGAGWTHYTGEVRGEKAKTCEAIWCRHQFSLRSPNAAALQGTSCGKGRHCIGGLCVTKTSPLGGDGSSGETFWESFSAGTRRTSTSTSTTATSVETSASTSEPGRVVYFPKTFDICQFFAQFGITLNDICQR